MTVPDQPVLEDGDVVLRFHGEATAAHRAVSFVIERQGQAAGSVELIRTGDRTADVRWSVSPDHRGVGVATRAVRLAVRYAFDVLQLERVVAYVERGDRASLRVAGRAGLRREGVVRMVDERIAQRHDRVQLARLATDPEPTSRDGFIGVLNAGLPTKRIIAQGLIRNNANEILLCELTYKQEWDLPGGVVDPGESPAHAVVREIREEMRVDVSPKSLVAVNWLPPWRGWDDATLFVFDLGVSHDVIARARLEPRELRALHWCSLEEVEHHAAPYVTRMLGRLWQPTQGTAYLEDGSDPRW